jgi:dephospho-CoA kinase
VDVDLLAKEIYKNNKDVVEKVSVVFGKEVLKPDGSVDFLKLGRIVFSESSQMKKLNNLMFPLIKAKVAEVIRKNQDKEYIIIDAAILFDAGLDSFCDRIIYLSADSKKREHFLKYKNSGLCIEDIRLRICNQKIKIDKDKIDFIIENDSSMEFLYKNIDDVIKKL